MIDAGSYRIIYDIIVALFTLKLALDYANKPSNKLQGNSSSFTSALLLAIFFAIFIGLRPLSGRWFVDMVNYDHMYNVMASTARATSWDTENKIFDNLILYLAQNQWEITAFFTLIAAIYFIVTCLATKRLFPGNTLAAYVVWLGSFSTFSYGTNGIKAGAAAAFFLLALSYRDKKVWALVWALVSIGFHHSMVVCGLAYLVALIYKKSKAYLAFWFLALVVSILHITDIQFLMLDFADDKASFYLNTTEGSEFGGKGGFRFDFVIYSAMPILVGYWALIRKRFQSEKYTLLFNIYVLVNSLWLLTMYASFTNRIAYLSWLMYPVVLVYPYLQMQTGTSRYRIFSQVALGSLAFTLFMTYVYYG